MKRLLLATLLLAHPASADNFTTAKEVRPILEATKSNWIAVRRWQGEDLLYFTHLEAWRCGLAGVRFSLNGSKALPYPLALCDETSAQPNALPDGTLPFLKFPEGSIQTISVEISYDDGTTASIMTDRQSVEIH